MTFRRRPVIGVTGPDHGGLAAWFATAFVIFCVGGRPRRITPKRALRGEKLDGLIIGGGADVSPELYGEPEGPPPQEAVSKSSRQSRPPFQQRLHHYRRSQPRRAGEQAHRRGGQKRIAYAGYLQGRTVD